MLVTSRLRDQPSHDNDVNDLNIRMSERLTRLHVYLLAVTLCVAFGVSSRATTPTFTPTGSLRIARAGHQAILLLDGRVLVTGGYDNAGIALAQAEIFSAVTGTWSLVASNAVARADHAATRLRDGRILVVGGAPALSSCIRPRRQKSTTQRPIVGP